MLCLLFVARRVFLFVCCVLVDVCRSSFVVCRSVLWCALFVVSFFLSCWLFVVCCLLLLLVGCLRFVVRCWLLVVGCACCSSLFVVGCWLVVVGW